MEMLLVNVHVYRRIINTPLADIRKWITRRQIEIRLPSRPVNSREPLSPLPDDRMNYICSCPVKRVGRRSVDERIMQLWDVERSSHATTREIPFRWEILPLSLSFSVSLPKRRRRSWKKSTPRNIVERFRLPTMKPLSLSLSLRRMFHLNQSNWRVFRFTRLTAMKQSHNLNHSFVL